MQQEIIQIIFGMKVAQRRSECGISLKLLAIRTGMSVSYLNEIEKGKKFPKVEKMIQLAKALETSYDALISPKLDGSLGPLGNILGSPFIQQFPFHIFGTSAREILQLMAGHPYEMGVLGRMLQELGRNYDMQLSQFFNTALRCYQMIHNNYFQDLEDLAADFRKRNGLAVDDLVTHEHMRRALVTGTDFTLVEKEAAAFPENLRSQRYFVFPERKELWLSRRLSAAQRGFVYAREIGYHLLGIKDRPLTSPTLESNKFDHVFDNFRVSYFAGALLLPQKRFHLDLKRIFAKTSWVEAREALLGLTATYGVTPETLFYRLSEIVPRCFKTKRVHFTKFTKEAHERRVKLEKQLNMSRLHIPNGIGLNEHFCGRWLSVLQLHAMDQQKEGAVLDAQRSKFLDYGSEFFCLTVAYRGTMRPNEVCSATLGFPVDGELRSTLKFWSDKEIPFKELGQTCERCPLEPGHCEERQVVASILEARRRQAARREALALLLAGEGDWAR